MGALAMALSVIVALNVILGVFNLFPFAMMGRGHGSSFETARQMVRIWPYCSIYQ